MPSLWADDLDAHRSLVRGRLLDAYDELHAQVGVEAVTLSAVAKRAGLARSAIYNYVDDKHDLVLASLQRTMDRVREGLAAAVRDAMGHEAKLRAYLAFTLAAHARGAASDDLMPMLAPEEQRRFLAMLAPLRQLLDELVGDAVADGAFAGDPHAIAELVWATVGGYRMAIASGRVDPVSAADAAGDLLISGLAAR